MPQPAVCVLRAPGTNCDRETAFAFERSGARAERLHLFRLLENPKLLAEFQILCIPGGFSYGDDIGAGVVFGSQLQHRLTDALVEFLQRDTLTLGICNGFQVLMRSGILPGGTESLTGNAHEPQATLTWNANGRYLDRWVKLRVDQTNSIFLKGIETLECPIAHAEGRLVARSPEVINGWRERGQIAARYAAHDVQEMSDELLPYPINPNSSVANIAGLSDPTGRILGLMPHPERFLFATQHPRWTRLGLRGEGAGMQLFRNAVAYYG